MNSVREWLEGLMQISNEKEGPEILRKELSAAIEDVLEIQAPSFDPWIEPLLTFEVRKLEKE